MTHKKTIKILLKCVIACVSLLCIIGLIFVYSSSSIYALEKCGSASYFLLKHCMGLGLGFVALLLIQYIPPDLIQSLTPLAFLSALALTLLTLLPSLSCKIHGSQRWITLAGFSFQPSELLKITMVLYIAHLLSRAFTKNHTLSSHARYTRFIIILLLVSGILLKQPDFGLTVTLVLSSCVMLFISQLYDKQLVLTSAALLPVACALVFLKPYRLQRILIFLNPWNDPQGAGFQIIQSLIAIGSGSLFGVGISNSKQKFFYLPMQHTDFIFSIIAEETGFMGAFFVITLYNILLYVGLKLAWKLNDAFCCYATIGFILLIHIQAMINICVATGLAPTKGIGLPFISYGNTSLVCSICMIGLILNFARHAIGKTTQ